MGADLCLACISIKFNPKDKQDIKLHGVENLIKVGTGLMLQALEDGGIMDREQWNELYESMSGDPAPDDDKKIIADATKIIEEFSECLGRRDTTRLDYPERTIILSGGISYGDSPTDGYDIISKFSCLPEWLLEIGGFK